jgi:hypothetical protein
MKKFKIIQSMDSELFTKEVQAFVNETRMKKIIAGGSEFPFRVRNVTDIQYAISHSATTRAPLFTALIEYTDYKE